MSYISIIETENIEFFEKCNFKISNFEVDKESKNYNACTFELNNLKIIFRKAKITPTKIGQFVTLWKRNKQKITEPFSVSDEFDFVIIYVKAEHNSGQFVFPKSVLIENGIISSDKKEGKRGFRVYPIWEIAINKQAIQTQKWQLNYFVKTNSYEELDLNLINKLY
jgi:hypothetical protein